MAVKTMNLAKLPVWIIVIQIFFFGAGPSHGDKRCSCYTFNNSTKLWKEARDSCSKHLVAIETEEEWEFLNKEIQTREEKKENEWFIGLYKNVTTRHWTWVNGKQLTIDKWQSNKPENNDLYALMAKEYPLGFNGSFSSFDKNVYRGWICEEETDICGRDCFNHIPVAPTTQGERTISTAYNSTTASAFTLTSSTSEVDGRNGDNDNSSILVIVAASLGAFVFFVLMILAVLLLRRRKRRDHGKEDENPPKNSSHQPAEIDQSQYESVMINDVEVAKLLGTPDTNKAEKKIEHVSPSENCEYAVVNKKDKKINEGDLVYAELAEFDSTNNDKTAKKTPSYEQSVYADVNVVSPEVRNPTSVDSAQPTYANVQTTGV